MKISDKRIEKQRIIKLSLDAIWWKWTTHEGLLTFFGYDNIIELKPGGRFEILFNKENPEGYKGSEGCTVVSFEPKRSFAFTWNSPPHFVETRKSSHKTLVEIRLSPISEDKTGISLTHSNWPDDYTWDGVYDYFEFAWEIVLNNLEKKVNFT